VARISFQNKLSAAAPLSDSGNDAARIDYRVFYLDGSFFHGAAGFPVYGDPAKGSGTSL
jgi:hypothetical protein